MQNLAQLDLEQQDLAQLDLEQYFLNQIILTKLYSMQLEQGHSPEIPIEQLEQLSQQIIGNLTQVYELELARSYNFQAV